MADEHILLGLVLDRLDRVDHTDILALLEGDLGKLELNVLQALLTEHFEELMREAISNASYLDGLFVSVTGQVLEEVAKIALVAVVVSTPLVQVRVGGEVLAADAISTRVRVHIAFLEDARLHVAIDLCDHACLWLVNFVKAKELGQVDDLGTFKGERKVQIGVHAVTSNCHKQVLILNIPQYSISLRVEVGNHDQTLVYWVKHVSMTSAINADTLGACLVGEYLLKRVLGGMLENESLVIDQVVAQLAACINKE